MHILLRSSLFGQDPSLPPCPRLYHTGFKLSSCYIPNLRSFSTCGLAPFVFSHLLFLRCWEWFDNIIVVSEGQDKFRHPLCLHHLHLGTYTWRNRFLILIGWIRFRPGTKDSLSPRHPSLTHAQQMSRSAPQAQDALLSWTHTSSPAPVPCWVHRSWDARPWCLPGTRLNGTPVFAQHP